MVSGLTEGEDERVIRRDDRVGVIGVVSKSGQERGPGAVAKVAADDDVAQENGGRGGEHVTHAGAALAAPAREAHGEVGSIGDVAGAAGAHLGGAGRTADGEAKGAAGEPGAGEREVEGDRSTGSRRGH